MMPTQKLPTKRSLERRQTNLRHINVSDTERWASLLGGGALALYGLSRGTVGGLALTALGGSLVYRGATGHCSLYGALNFSAARPHSPQASIAAGSGIKIERSITILRPPGEIYKIWRDFPNLPRFMRHLESVQLTGPNRYHWIAKGPLGHRVEWDAEVITERENELIGWRSLEGSEVDTAGSVHFSAAPGDRGTEVKVALKYDPPGGKVAVSMAWVFGMDAAQEIEEDLRRLKAFLETGTVPSTAGQPRGQCS